MTHAESRYLHRAQEKRGLIHNLKLALIIGAVLLLVIIIEGCSSGSLSPSPPSPSAAQPALSKPAADLISMPRVAILGDNLVSSNSWGTSAIQAQNPLWEFFGPPANAPPEDSGNVLARLPQVLDAATKFDVLVILTGTADMEDPSWLGFCDYTSPPPTAITIQTCQAEWLMINLAHQAGLKVVLCTVPLTEQQAAIYTDRLNEAETIYDENIIKSIGEGVPPEQWTQDATVNLSSAEGSGGVLEGVTWTTDGELFNDSGAQAATSAVQAAISGLKIRAGVK